MKKKRIIGMGCSIVILVAIGIIYFLKAPIVSINGNILNGEQVANQCDILLGTADEIDVSYVSTVSDGALAIRLLDEGYNVIKDFQANTAGKEKVYLEAGKYYFRVDSDFFKGNYKVRIYN